MNEQWLIMNMHDDASSRCIIMLMMHHDASSSRCIMNMHRDDEQPEEVPLENMFNPAVRRRDSCTAASPHGLAAVHGQKHRASIVQ